MADASSTDADGGDPVAACASDRYVVHTRHHADHTGATRHCAMSRVSTARAFCVSENVDLSVERHARPGADRGIAAASNCVADNLAERHRAQRSDVLRTCGHTAPAGESGCAHLITGAARQNVPPLDP